MCWVSRRRAAVKSWPHTELTVSILKFSYVFLSSLKTTNVRNHFVLNKSHPWTKDLVSNWVQTNFRSILRVGKPDVFLCEELLSHATVIYKVVSVHSNSVWDGPFMLGPPHCSNFPQNWPDFPISLRFHRFPCLFKASKTRYKDTGSYRRGSPSVFSDFAKENRLRVGSGKFAKTPQRPSCREQSELLCSLPSVQRLFFLNMLGKGGLPKKCVVKLQRNPWQDHWNLIFTFVQEWPLGSASVLTWSYYLKL